jgi:hypothetical protein
MPTNRRASEVALDMGVDYGVYLLRADALMVLTLLLVFVCILIMRFPA